MEEKEVISFLQHYRHDLMNKLQLVHGYLTMGNADKAEERLQELFSYFHEERKLVSLNAPKFALWLLRFNSEFDCFRLKYYIHMEYSSLLYADEVMLNSCNKVMDFLRDICDPMELYDLSLELLKNDNTANLEVLFWVHGNFDTVNTFECLEENKENENRIHADKVDSGLLFRIEIPHDC